MKNSGGSKALTSLRPRTIIEPGKDRFHKRTTDIALYHLRWRATMNILTYIQIYLQFLLAVLILQIVFRRTAGRSPAHSIPGLLGNFCRVGSFLYVDLAIYYLIKSFFTL